ncbi:MAG: M48 family metallopeptidase [Hydrogenophilales bacterium]|nr:M48 family metallopeptidase [Hydrogenophilales bacterium]
MAYPLKETRVIQLGGQVLSYTLVRRKRRTIGFKVDFDGLTVSAPPREPYTYLDQLISERARWISAKLREMETRRLPERKWQNGERLPLLGDELELYLYRTYTRSEPLHHAGRIYVGVPDTHDAPAVQTRIANWYRRQAERHFQERVNVLAPSLGVAAPRLKLSNARTTWGMCLPSGEIRLSWRLIKAPPAQIDYVVAHELAHLKHMNHSRAFWATVAQLYPDYQRERQALARDGALYHTF